MLLLDSETEFLDLENRFRGAGLKVCVSGILWRAGDAGDGNRVFPAAVFERALGHGAGDGLADEAVLESMVSEESFFRVRDSRGLFKG